MKKEIVEENIKNSLGKDLIYNLLEVRDRIQKKQVSIPEAQAEITAAKHIIQVMALELKSQELSNVCDTYIAEAEKKDLKRIK